MKEIITVGYYKGEMDFGVNCSIADLTIEEMNSLRQMTMVAIGQAEQMWARSRQKESENQTAQVMTSTPKLK